MRNWAMSASSSSGLKLRPTSSAPPSRSRNRTEPAVCAGRASRSDRSTTHQSNRSFSRPRGIRTLAEATSVVGVSRSLTRSPNSWSERCTQGPSPSPRVTWNVEPSSASVQAPDSVTNENGATSSSRAPASASTPFASTSAGSSCSKNSSTSTTRMSWSVRLRTSSDDMVPTFAVRICALMIVRTFWSTGRASTTCRGASSSRRAPQANDDSASSPSSGKAPVIMGCQLPTPTPPPVGSVMRTTVSRI